VLLAGRAKPALDSASRAVEDRAKPQRIHAQSTVGRRHDGGLGVTPRASGNQRGEEFTGARRDRRPRPGGRWARWHQPSVLRQ
jgi:hypothetical protein